MSQNLKYILTFIASLAFMALCWYGLGIYDKHETRKYELSEIEVKHSKAIDSLELKIYADSLKYAEIKEQKETEKTNRIEYNANYQKRKQITAKTDYNSDKSFNDNFILNFQPKY